MIEIKIDGLNEHKLHISTRDSIPAKMFIF